MAIDLTQFTKDTTPNRMRPIATYLAEVDINQLAALDAGENTFWDHVYTDAPLGPRPVTSLAVADSTGGNGSVTWTDTDTSSSYVIIYLTSSTGSETMYEVLTTGVLWVGTGIPGGTTIAFGAGDVAVIVAGVDAEGNIGSYAAPAYQTIT